MNKKNKLALFTLLVVGLFSLFTISIFTQKSDSVKSEQPVKQCSGEKFVMPQSVPVNNEAFTTFTKVMSLPSGRRQRMFSGISNEEKANVFKVQLALNFTKRPNLTKEQKDLILETISKISADAYDKGSPKKAAKAEKNAQELQAKSLSIFPPNEAYTIFASLSGEKEDVDFLKKYESFLSLSTMAERQKFFRDSSPFEKSELWKAQMIYYLATTNFNKAQQELVVEIISLSTQKAFVFPTIDGEEKNTETKALDALETKANNLFSKEEIFAFFMSFGIHKVMPPINTTLADEVSPAEDLRGDCNCNYFCFRGNCRGSYCQGTLSGCGWSGDVPCVFNCQ